MYFALAKDKTDVPRRGALRRPSQGNLSGFDVSGGQDKFGRVDYQTEAIPLSRENEDVGFAWKLLSTKFKKWEYEKEWRVFTAA